MSTESISRPFPWESLGDQAEVEVLRGIELPKMSPQRRHARLQGLLFALLDAWAGAGGQVGTEWRFWLSRSPLEETSLVPDVAFVTAERLAALDDEQAEEPPFAPDIAVEIRSPGDRERNIKAKAALYLAAGARVVLDVDPDQRRIVAYDAAGERVFAEAASFAHPAFPGLAFDVAALFASADRPRDLA
jgi:Uma2 family endonuclease